MLLVAHAALDACWEAEQPLMALSALPVAHILAVFHVLVGDVGELPGLPLVLIAFLR